MAGTRSRQRGWRGRIPSDHGAQHTRLPFLIVCWAVTRAEAVEAVSMQGWQLAGGCASPHSLYFCCLCHVNATKTDDVIGLVPPSYFSIDLRVRVSEPPLWVPASAAGLQLFHLPPSLGRWDLAGCSLQAPPAPRRLMGTGLFSEAPSHLWRHFFLGGEEVYEGDDIYFVN